jgi:hypothetical protein
MFLFNFVNYVFLLCMFRSGYSVSLCCSCIVCVLMCTALLPPGVNPIAVNKYIISYLIVSIVKVSIKGKQFCDVTSYSLVDMHQRLGGTCLSPF